MRDDEQVEGELSLEDLSPEELDALDALAREEEAAQAERAALVPVPRGSPLPLT